MPPLVFTIAITCASRTLMLRDQLLGWPRERATEKGTTAFTQHRIPSGSNVLDAVLMQPAGRAAQASVLICHGIGETVGHWRAAQRLLAENDVASLVFNYSGYGRSTGRIDAEQCERDAMAAFHFLQERVPSETISLLGFSLGSGIATAIVTRVAVHRLVLCAAFPSLRKAARSMGVPHVAARLLPDIWKTEETLRTCATPVVIVHGEKDRLFPAQMARDLASACRIPCELMLMPGLSHNAPIYQPQPSYWRSIAMRL